MGAAGAQRCLHGTIAQPLKGDKHPTPRRVKKPELAARPEPRLAIVPLWPPPPSLPLPLAARPRSGRAVLDETCATLPLGSFAYTSLRVAFCPRREARFLAPKGSDVSRRLPRGGRRPPAKRCDRCAAGRRNFRCVGKRALWESRASFRSGAG